MAAHSDFLRSHRDGDVLVVQAAGAWTIDRADELDREIRALDPSGSRCVRLDLSPLEALDTLGAWLLVSRTEAIRSEGIDLEVDGLGSRYRALVQQVRENREALEAEAPRGRRGASEVVRSAISACGRAIVWRLAEARDFVAFVGLVLAVLARTLTLRQRFEFASTMHHVQQVWINALPIVGLLAFLVGVVIVYQGATQLERFGASTLAIDMVAITVLREIGVLLAALLVGGRSGSSFTAQIGAMKARHEVSAMRATGIDPVAALVVPRVLALVITFPLLGFWAVVMALLGGGLMAWAELGFAPEVFLERVLETVDGSSFAVGMIKAPVYASIIALVGCFQGLRVEGTASEVGRMTTRAVVQTIFLIIFTDALFSIFFRFVKL